MRVRRQDRAHLAMLVPSASDCDKVKRFAVDASEQNLDRLEAELSRMS